MAATRSRLDSGLGRVLFASRWLLAPFYIGMILALFVILVVFCRELFYEVMHIQTLDAEGAILLSLSLIDLSLAGNLTLIVMLSGYENFVSKIHLENASDRPTWMGTVDFSGLKIKLIASIVAISGIALLRAFLPLGDPGAMVDTKRIGWMLAIHLTFVVSGVLLAVMDWVTSKMDAH